MSVKQCNGITKKGNRCLKKVTTGSMCHYHVGQIPGLVPTPPKVQLPLNAFPTQWEHKNSPTPIGSPKRTPFGSPKKSPFGSPKKSLSASSSLLSMSSSATKNSLASTPNLPPSPRMAYKPLSSPKIEASLKPGYIYVYTLAELLNKNNRGGWLKTRNLLADPKNKDKWIDFNARELDMLLVKVGMTTQTVSKRILQWEAKCNHKIECLYPSSPKDPSQPLSFLKKFERLTLRNLSSTSAYQSFQENAHGFFVPRDVMRAEKQIHDLLKLKFGRGDVYCTGCVAKAQEKEKGFSLQNLFKKREFVESDYNVHVEWFPIPKRQMKEVYRIIDSVCVKYVP